MSALRFPGFEVVEEKWERGISRLMLVADVPCRVGRGFIHLVAHDGCSCHHLPDCACVTCLSSARREAIDDQVWKKMFGD
jgi:hypothetical protein